MRSYWQIVLEDKNIEIDGKEYIKSDDAYDAVYDAMKDIAWKVHIMISEGKSKAEIDKYVTDLCDF